MEINEVIDLLKKEAGFCKEQCGNLKGSDVADYWLGRWHCAEDKAMQIEFEIVCRKRGFSIID